MSMYKNIINDLVIKYYQNVNNGNLIGTSSNLVYKENPMTNPINNSVSIGTYEIKKTIFGKEKVRKVKNENRTIGIEYSS